VTKLCFFVSFIAIALAPVAQAEPTDTVDQPDLNGVICGQMALGETPIEIAERLHQGDRRISQAQAGQKVWETLPDCNFG
jgi:hypothetical protein